jgi:hypothetical protein
MTILKFAKSILVISLREGTRLSRLRVDREAEKLFSDRQF